MHLSADERRHCEFCVGGLASLQMQQRSSTCARAVAAFSGHERVPAHRTFVYQQEVVFRTRGHESMPPSLPMRAPLADTGGTNRRTVEPLVAPVKDRTLRFPP